MSGMMLHGLGDCTPELHCGCLSPDAPAAAGADGEFVRDGVCLLCGGAVLDGEHIDLDRHVAEVERITAGATVTQWGVQDVRDGWVWTDPRGMTEADARMRPPVVSRQVTAWTVVDGPTGQEKSDG